jgi:DNA-binding CsgD family transcriptional regulator
VRRRGRVVAEEDAASTPIGVLARGGGWRRPHVARSGTQGNLNFPPGQPPERAEYNLSPHEMRLLKLLSDGHNYKTAAGKLGLSINTVSFHMRGIYEKLHVHSKSEAVAKALRSGILR